MPTVQAISRSGSYVTNSTMTSYSPYVEVAQPIAVHVHDEVVAGRRRCVTGRAHQHAGRVDGNVSAGLPQQGEDGRWVGSDGPAHLKSLLGLSRHAGSLPGPATP